jgi:hypothetical protein
MRTLLNHLQESLLSLINRFGYRLTLIDRISFLEPLLYSLLKANGHVSFVQIGANDGKQSDALYRFIAMNRAKVSGIVVEPVKDYFQELSLNYRRFPTIIPVNVAIHHEEKHMTMYRSTPPSSVSCLTGPKALLLLIHVTTYFPIRRQTS